MNVVQLYNYGAGNSASRFITAAGITDETQKSAIKVLVSSLKSNGLWSKMKAIYPIVGGNATSHKFNLKDPRDLDGAYRLTYSGTVNHSLSGVSGTGTIITNLNAFNVLDADDMHLSNYCISETNGTIVDIGTGTGSSLLAVYQRFNNLAVLDLPRSTRGTASNSVSKAYYIGTRTSNSSAKMYKNGSSIVTTSITRTDSLPSGFIQMLHVDIYQSDRTYAFYTIGSGLTDTDAANLYTIVQAFNTSLGRNN